MSLTSKIPSSIDFERLENELRLAHHEVQELRVGLEYAINCNAKRRVAHDKTLQEFRAVLRDFTMFCKNREDPDVVRDVGNPAWLQATLARVENELRLLTEKP